MRSAACLLAVFFFPAVTNTQPAPTFKIAGCVVRRETNRPVPRAQVLIRMVEHPDRELSVRSGDNGEFSFANLPAAKYQLQVTYRGWSQLLEQWEEFSTAVVTGAGQDSEHILFKLDSPATLAGSVLDDDGDPVAQAQLYLFNRSILHGSSRIVSRNQTNTNTDGTFRFGNLQTGTYYVAVMGRPWYAQNPAFGQSQVQRNNSQPEPRSPLDVAFPLTYYAEALTPEAATPLTLEEGARAEIRFTLHAVPALHITVDGIEKGPDQQIQTVASYLGPGGAQIGVPVTGFNGEIYGLAPGNYILSTNLFAPNNGNPSPAGSQAVNLTTDGAVHLNPAVKTSVRGRVILGSGIPPGLQVLIRTITQMGYSAPVKPDGSFIIPDMPPGHYDFLLANSNLYIDKLAAKGATYANAELDLRLGAQAEVVINAASGLTKVDGITVKDKTPVPGAMVLLIPQDRNLSMSIPRDQSDGDGTFTLYRVPPGRYTLLAIQNGRNLAYADPAVIAPYLKRGRVIDLPLAKGVKVEAEVQPR